MITKHRIITWEKDGMYLAVLNVDDITPIIVSRLLKISVILLLDCFKNNIYLFFFCECEYQVQNESNGLKIMLERYPRYTGEMAEF